MIKFRKLFPAMVLAVMLAVHSAGAETMLQINGDQPPKSAEEILQMVEEAANDYYRDQEIAEELREEISSEEATDSLGWTYTVYTLKHGGNAMRFLMEQKENRMKTAGIPCILRCMAEEMRRRKKTTSSGTGCSDTTARRSGTESMLPAAGWRIPGICISARNPIRCTTA